MSQAIITSMQSAIESLGGGKSGAFALFVLIIVALQCVVWLFRKTIGNTNALRVVETMACGVWTYFFLAIGWNFTALLFALIAAFKAISLVVDLINFKGAEPELAV